MSIYQITSEALRLPPETRAPLAESPRESLDDSYVREIRGRGISALALALERDSQIENSEVQEISHD